MGIELDEEEKVLDEKRLEEELEILGPIGYKNAKEPYVRFPEAIDQIDQMCKDICQKLYVGDNIKYLEGNDKIPQYLSIFLEHMKKQAEDFKINMVRQLRTSSQRLQNLCQEIPKSAYNYLKVRYEKQIEDKVTAENEKFDKMKENDQVAKQEHLRLFRPNLANPANKEDTQVLNKKEQDRIEAFIDLIDDT